jgi:excisionase family DNA binding protein
VNDKHAGLQGRYTVKQAAALAEVHHNTLTTWINKGLVPGAEKVGGRYMIWKEPFDQWRLKGQRTTERAA